MPELTVACHAKINLSLEILRRREDGYHDLATVFQAVSLCDELRLRVEPASGLPVHRLQIGGLSVPVPGNLVLRALEAFEQHTGVPSAADVKLHKRIPAGAGLGGGSSDAAGTLLALSRLCRGAPADLSVLAAGLGSDVPFFLGSGTALGGGRGELLTPLPTPADDWLVLAKPEVAVNTGEAYGLLTASDFGDGGRSRACAEALRAGCGLRQTAADLYNGFAAPVERRWPSIRVLRERLLAAGAETALLSGSGAAVFGIFPDQPAAEAAAVQLALAGYWAVAARPVAHGLVVT